MNENLPSVFNHDEFGSIRVVMQNGEPWFVAKDVCDALNIENPSQAVIDARFAAAFTADAAMDGE